MLFYKKLCYGIVSYILFVNKKTYSDSTLLLMSHHRYPPAPGLGPFARNASLIWCALNNWGGAVHLGGDLEYVLNETRDALATDAVVGVGLTPEGEAGAWI